MGVESASSSSNSNSNSSSQYDENDKSNKNNNSTLVVLNVYDLTPINNYMYWFGFGIFHSGIQVFGKEYGFGAHDFPASGVFEVEPKNCPGFIYRCSITLGQVHMSPSEFRTFIENMASEYYGDTYHLISKNCNHFTDDVSYRLIGKQIPGWVNRLAKLGALCSCLLPECLQETTVKQIPDYHECSEDEFIDSLSTPTPHGSQEIDNEQEKHLLLPSAGAEDVTFVKEAHVK
ncbi:deSI-like protein At4g17486 [Cicer arietinum]|uniref:DeSI-like protein At4g17486 n=1 Tax=Cicer arietinum TaxID=3827 RepID=A0A1S2YQY9_CICAR|nr:deSI-like protein At4g17486 [Cicer arietinum]XP_004508532.1 deSI-like protein At4g17486 [Cicer arietinum]XP_004508533.1 deSI-like protein At4g17486 [Cicer arietinum]